MTSSDHESSSRARHAANANLAPDLEPRPGAVADDDASAATSGSVTGPPDDIQELRQEIADTRDQLGDTVQQLAAKTDVGAVARGKAVELTRKVKGKASQTQARAATVAKPVLAATPEPVRQAVVEGARAARQRWAPLAAAAAALAGCYLAIRRWRRR
jgi:hypothetical protein